MTDRDRLIELLMTDVECDKECSCEVCEIQDPDICMKECANATADLIIADGWIRPPCKVGDTIYIIDLFDYEPCKRSGKCGDVCPHLYAEYGVGYECKKGKYGEKPFSCAEIKTEVIEDITQIFSNWTWFGKIVFLTREDAERALRECGDEK